MNGTEMLRRLRVALEDEEQPYKNSTDRIWLWLQGAYMDRLLQSSFWSFLHQRSSLIVTEGGTRDYTVPLIKDLDPDSIYYMRSESEAKIPMLVKDYDLWVEEQASGVSIAPSPPLYLIENPDKSWKVDPEPDGVYTIYADRWHKPSEMADHDAEPLWEEEYHEIVVLDAMKIAAALRPDSPSSAVMIRQVQERLPKMERAFRARYLPSIGRAGAHV